MSRNFEYDDSNLQKLFAQLDIKQRLRAMKASFRKEANRVRKVAVNNLRSSGLSSNKNLEKGIRALVFKKKAGFRVTIGTKKANKKGRGEAGYYTNRQGLKKPILIWAEEGTDPRKTKTKTRVYTRARKGHNTGRMRRYGFMRKTLKGVRNSVTDSLHNEVRETIIKYAKRYGCK